MRVFTLILLLLEAVQAYKIVIFAPDIANSQVMFNKRVAQVLADAGHDVTIAFSVVFDGRDNSDVKIANNIKIYSVNASIGVSKAEADLAQSKIIFQPLDTMGGEMREHFTKFMRMLTDSCRSALRNKPFMDWLVKEQFDIAFAHPYHMCPIGLIHHAQIPTWIWLQSGHLMDHVSRSVGVPLIPSFVPPVMLDLMDEMTFMERAKSLFITIMAKNFYPKMVSNRETQMFREEVDPNFPDLMELAKECPLVLVNSNEFYELPRPTLAKVVNIGGIGAEKKDTKPLPEQFEKIANNGKGIILVSFGSVAPSALIPDSWKTALIGAFTRLPDYQFVVRYEGKDLQNKIPSNVHLTKWMPQSDLLQHPKTKAFLTHGGYNSLQEAINAGKPLVTIGLFGDQPKNEKIAKKHGFAVNLSKANFTAEAVYDALTEVLENPRYLSSAQRLSAMVAKRPVSPEQLLVKWTEFVAEFKTLENLVPAGTKLNFVQYHSLDVIAVILTLVSVVLYILLKLLVCTARCVCCKKTRKEKVQ